MSARDIASELAKSLGSAGVGDAASKALDALAREDTTALAAIAGTAMGGPALGLALLLGGIVLQSIGKRKDKKALKAEFDRVLAEVLSARNDMNRLDVLLRPMVERTNFLNQRLPGHEKADIASIVADKVKRELASLLPENANAIDFDSIRIYLERNTSLLREIKSSLSKIHDKLDGLRDLYTSGQIATPTIPEGVRDNFAIAGISRNASFVGRTSTLSQLHAAVTDASATAIVLNAEGGVGKSEIAKAYVFHDEFNQHWDGVWWLDASSVAIDRSLEQLLDRLGRPRKPGEDLPAMRAALASRLGNGRHLLVLDNVEDLNTLSDFVLPECCWKLATTRLPPDHIPPQQGVTLRIDVLSDDEAAALLLERRDELCEPKQPGKLRSPLSEHAEATREITGHLGNHALAIAFAAAALGQQPRPSLPKLLERLRTAEVDAKGHAFERLKPGDIGTKYGRKVAEALLLLFPDIGAAHPAAFPIMGVVSLCHHERIPLSLVSRCLTSNADAVEAAVHALHRASIVRVQDSLRADGSPLLDAHPLTQSAVRGQLGPDAMATIQQDLLHALLAVYSNTNDSHRWHEMVEAVPHAEHMLAQLPPSEPKRMKLYGQLANIYEQVARLEEAERCYREILSTLEATDSNDTQMHIVISHNLAGVLAKTNRPQQAFQIEMGAMQRLESTTPGDHLDKVAILQGLAGALATGGHDNEALLALRQAFGMASRLSRLDNHHTSEAIAAKALALDTIGNVHFASHRFAKAVKFHRRAVQVYGELDVGDGMPVAVCMGNLACALDGDDKHDEAQVWHERSLDIFRRRHQSDHPDVAMALRCLARNCYCRGRREDAILHMESAIKVARGCLPPDDPRIKADEESLAAFRMGNDKA